MSEFETEAGKIRNRLSRILDWITDNLRWIVVLMVVAIGCLFFYHKANPCADHSGVSAFSGVGGYTGRVLCNDGALIVTDEAQWDQVQGR